MPGQGRPRWRFLWALVCAGPLAPAPPQAGAADAPQAVRLDAQLAALASFGPNHVWAVGDRGTIWQTTNGGTSWHLQSANVDARLQSVQFLDAEHGWVAGGVIDPYTKTSRGILLKTSDGGRHWTSEPRLGLPAIRRIHFVDSKQGWAITCPATLFPTGLFSTSDGGRSWSPVSSAADADWLAGAFSDAQGGIVAGRQQTAAVARRQGIDPPAMAELGPRSLHDVKLATAREAWLVGDGNLVLTSRDRGRSWVAPEAKLPLAAGASFDFYGLATNASHCWIVGSPGSKVFHCAGGGAEWQVFDTGQSLPLHAVCFATEDRGWAVGDLGTILSTHDGGRSWRIERQGGTRAALLGIFEDARQTPCELIAYLAGDEGYRCVVQILSRMNQQAARRPMAGEDARLHDAVLRLDGSAGAISWRWQNAHRALGMPPESTLPADSGGASDIVAAWKSEIVRAIRIWQPAVVVTSLADPPAGSPHSLVNRAVLAAVRDAGDAAAEPEQLASEGLKPWTVSKVYGVLPPSQSGGVNVSPGQFSSRFGTTLADVGATARSLLVDEEEPSGANCGFRLLLDRVATEQGRRDLFGGISLAPGSDARRAVASRREGSGETLRRAAQRLRNTEAIIARSASAPQAPERLLAEMGELSRDWPSDQVARLWFQFGNACRRRGQFELAAEAYAALVRASPDEALAGAALEWLVRYYASGEMAYRLRQGASLTSSHLAARPPEPATAASDRAAGERTSDSPPGDSRSFGAEPAERGASDAASLATFPSQTDTPSPAARRARRPRPVVPAGGESAAVELEPRLAVVRDSQRGHERQAKALEFSRLLEERHPQLHADPANRFALAAMQRTQGHARQAERIYLGFRRAERHDSWWRSAQGEAWLAEPRGPAPKPTYRAGRTTAAPHLDGEFDDLCWSYGERIRLVAADRAGATHGRESLALATSSDSMRPTAPGGDAALERQAQEQLPASVTLCRDDQFLYLGIECVKPAGAPMAQTHESRRRDADQSGWDRIEILLDVDRDGTTWYRLSVDARGWTADDCWHDATWDPIWYVAAAETPRVWSIEAAIPLDALVDRAPASGEVWSLGVQRIVPGVCLQSWTEPASVDARGEDFGWLLFE